MKQLGFYIDAAKCTGCKTCVVACKDAHDLPVGMNLRKVIEYAGGGWRQDRMTGAWGTKTSLRTTSRLRATTARIPPA